MKFQGAVPNGRQIAVDQKVGKLTAFRAAMKTIARHCGPFVGVIACFVIFGSLSEAFLSLQNMVNIARQTAVNLILACGMTFVVIGGGIDLSVGAVMALAGTLVAGLIKGGVPVPLGIVMGLLLGAACGFFNGIFVARLGIAPFVATMASMSVARSLALIYSGGYPITGLPASFGFWGTGYVGPIPFPVVVAGTVFLISHFLLTRTAPGLYMYAIGGNEEAAYLSGLRVSWWKVFSYTLSGFLAALGGIVLTGRMNSAQPTIGVGTELEVIAAVVIGGTSLSGGQGSVVGSLAGALIIAILNNGLTLLNVSPYYHGALIGVVILIAVWVDSRQKRKG